MCVEMNGWKRALAAVVFSAGTFASGCLGWAAAGYIPQEEETASAPIGENAVLVGGMPVGIYMETDGVLVLDTQSIEGIDGLPHEPAQNLVKEGDYIVGINQKQVSRKEDLTEALQHLEDTQVILTLRRETQTLDVRLDAVEAQPADYKLGIWVRDNIQGLGTVTFLDQNSHFGALGHGIHDADTSVLMQIREGSLYKTSIRSILKGENGIPGSMEGMIVYNTYNRLGTIDKNTEAGIYGSVEELDTLFPEQIPVEVATKEEIEIGDATIRCFLEDSVQEYTVKITGVDYEAEEINKGLILQVTDPLLLEKTGGIVQGMSGSPILQNGRLIGAVTHVFVNDPTKGYGIFAETMMAQLQE
ncbi:MAG: SpoIVB peptidase [Ruminococcus sp.]|nr:SpoIVB peptidase [Ruminococcus sp.]